MNRRQALMASIAVMGQIVIDNETLKAQTLSTSATLWKPPEELTVQLGGHNSFKRFTFTDGADTVTFTAVEIMAALKASC